MKRKQHSKTTWILRCWNLAVKFTLVKCHLCLYPCAPIDLLFTRIFIMCFHSQWTWKSMWARQEMYISWYSSVTYTIHAWTLFVCFLKEGHDHDPGKKLKAKYKFQGDATPTLKKKSSRNQDFTKLDLQKFEGRGIRVYTKETVYTKRGEPSHNLK